MNIQLTPAKLIGYVKTLAAWAGLIVSVTDTVPALHSVRPTMLACSSLLLTVEHGITKMNGAQANPTNGSVQP